MPIVGVVPSYSPPTPHIISQTMLYPQYALLPVSFAWSMDVFMFAVVDTQDLYDPGHGGSHGVNPPELRQPPTDTWFIRHRRYISDRYLWKAFFAMSLIPLAVLLIGFGIFSATHNGVWDHSDDHCLPVESARYFVWVFVGTLVAPFYIEEFLLRSNSYSMRVRHRCNPQPPLF